MAAAGRPLPVPAQVRGWGVGFQPNQVAAGPLRLVARNVGKLRHALVVRGDDAEWPIGQVPPGEARGKTIGPLRPGPSTTLCALPGRRVHEMSAVLAVDPAAVGSFSPSRLRVAASPPAAATWTHPFPRRPASR